MTALLNACAWILQKNSFALDQLTATYTCGILLEMLVLHSKASIHGQDSSKTFLVKE
jgi:hypothetical protein